MADAGRPGQGGFYTYSCLENLIGLDIHRADSVHPEWQELSVGDSSRLAPRDYLWGIGEGAGRSAWPPGDDPRQRKRRRVTRPLPGRGR